MQNLQTELAAVQNMIKGVNQMIDSNINRTLATG
jgi:hypothetical protein